MKTIDKFASEHEHRERNSGALKKKKSRIKSISKEVDLSVGFLVFATLCGQISGQHTFAKILGDRDWSEVQFSNGHSVNFSWKVHSTTLSN